MKTTFAILLLFCGACWSQPSIDQSLASVKTLDDLDQILVKNGFKVGYERIGATQIETRQGSVEDLLSFAGRVAREAGYTLAFTGERSVHILPTQSEPSPLDSPIEKITLKEQSVDEAIREIGKQANLPLQTYGLSKVAGKNIVNLTVKDVTVREALDKVMDAAKLSGWIANLPPPNEKPFVIIVQVTAAQ